MAACTVYAAHLSHERENTMAAAQLLSTLIMEYRAKKIYVFNIQAESQWVLKITFSNHNTPPEPDKDVYVYATNEYDSKVIVDSGVHESFHECSESVKRQVGDIATIRGKALEMMKPQA